MTWVEASGAAHHALDGDENAVEARDLLAQLPPARRGDRVVARLAPGRRLGPLRRDPPFLLETLEGGIERPLLDREHFVGQPLDVLRDGVAMQRLHGERLEDQHVERPAEELALLWSAGLGHGESRTGYRI